MSDSSNVTSKEETELRKWEWLPCIYDFKQCTDDKEIVWNFSPYVMLSSGDPNVSFILPLTLKIHRKRTQTSTLSSRWRKLLSTTQKSAGIGTNPGICQQSP